MDNARVKEDAVEEESGRNDRFFIEDLNSSEDEQEISSASCEQAARLSKESSPPLLLAFSTTSGWVQKDSSQSPTSSLDLQLEGEEEEADSDQPIEEWMILGREGELGDSSIQLNLSYWNSSEEDSGGEGEILLDPKSRTMMVKHCVDISLSTIANHWHKMMIFYYVDENIAWIYLILTFDVAPTYEYKLF